MKNGPQLRTWLSRVIDRMHFSRRAGTISQKVPKEWMEIARSTSQRIHEAVIRYNVDDVLGADETFILFYCNDKLLPALAPVLFCPFPFLSSSILPAFVIDGGVYGGDLIKQWLSYIKSTEIFNPTYCMN